MRRVLPLIVLIGLATLANAQNADPLAVTLPSGKVIHFQSDEQKARYEAALQKRAISPAAVSAVPSTETAKPHSTDAGSTATTNEQSVSAKVNASAPAFTADYYTAMPDGWAGRKITLSVAYFSTSGDESEKVDGLQRLTAQTYNTTPGLAGSQSFGGHITVFATPEAAAKLLQQCGTRYQYQASGWLKTTLIKGEFRPMEAKGAAKAQKEFAVYVAD